MPELRLDVTLLVDQAERRQQRKRRVQVASAAAALALLAAGSLAVGHGLPPAYDVYCVLLNASS